jgi:hypothetical protein
MEWTHNEFKNLLLEYDKDYTKEEVNERWIIMNTNKRDESDNLFHNIYTCSCGMKFKCRVNMDRPTLGVLKTHLCSKTHLEYEIYKKRKNNLLV